MKTEIHSRWSYQNETKSGNRKERSLESPSLLFSDAVRIGEDRSEQRQQQSRRARGPLLVGKSTGLNLKAAKKVIKKAVFYVDNLCPDTTVNDLVVFVEQYLGVKVLSCFDVLPRRRRGDPEDDDYTACFPSLYTGRRR